MLVNALILAALIKVNLVCESPWVATCFYGGMNLAWWLIQGASFGGVLFGLLIHLPLVFLYFWALKKTEDKGVWWLIMLMGPLFPLLLAFI